MAETFEVKFITKYQTVMHLMPLAVFTDPETDKPYQFAKVHGNTWQTTFMSNIDDEIEYEAFTPSKSEYNHRGFYEWCPVSNAYKLI